MPKLLSVATSPASKRRGRGADHGAESTRQKLTEEGRANILFQAHLTNTEAPAPKNFSPKVIRSAALCSPRHFLDERASFRSVSKAVSAAITLNTGAKGKSARQRKVREVLVSKKKKSMLATVKTRAPTVEVLTSRRTKLHDLLKRGQEYDRKYETSEQKEQKEFSSWLDKLGTKADPGRVPMDNQYRKTIEKAVKETTLSKHRAGVKQELAQLFNYFLLAGAGEHEYLDLVLKPSVAPANNEEGFVATSPVSKPRVALRGGGSVPEQLLNCGRLFNVLRSISFNKNVLAKGHRFAREQGMNFVNLAQFEDWWRFGCLSAGCKISSAKGGILQFDLSAASKASRVWWRSHQYMVDAIADAPPPPGAVQPPRTHTERIEAEARQRRARVKLDLELATKTPVSRDRVTERTGARGGMAGSPARRPSVGASGGIVASPPHRQQSTDQPKLDLPEFLQSQHRQATNERKEEEVEEKERAKDSVSEGESSSSFMSSREEQEQEQEDEEKEEQSDKLEPPTTPFLTQAAQLVEERRRTRRERTPVRPMDNDEEARMFASERQRTPSANSKQSPSSKLPAVNSHSNSGNGKSKSKSNSNSNSNSNSKSNSKSRSRNSSNNNTPGSGRRLSLQWHTDNSVGPTVSPRRSGQTKGSRARPRSPLGSLPSIHSPERGTRATPTHSDGNDAKSKKSGSKEHAKLSRRSRSRSPKFGRNGRRSSSSGGGSRRRTATFKSTTSTSSSISASKTKSKANSNKKAAAAGLPQVPSASPPKGGKSTSRLSIIHRRTGSNSSSGSIGGRARVKSLHVKADEARAGKRVAQLPNVFDDNARSGRKRQQREPRVRSPIRNATLDKPALTRASTGGRPIKLTLRLKESDGESHGTSPKTRRPNWRGASLKDLPDLIRRTTSHH